MRRLFVLIACLLASPVWGQTSGVIRGDVAGIARTLFRTCTVGQVLVKDASTPYGVACGDAGAGGNPFDQDLNTDDDVVFASVTAANIPITATFNFSAAQLRTSNSIPLELVAAPGEGRAVRLLWGTSALTFNGVAFSNLTEMHFNYDGLSTALTVQIEMAQGDSYFTIIPTVSREVLVVEAENKSLLLVGNGDDAEGDSTLRVMIQYEIVDLP